MALLVLSSSHVAQISRGFSPSYLMSLMSSVFIRTSAQSDVILPLRTSIATDRHTTLWMPSRVKGMGTTMKVASVPSPGTGQSGLPATTLMLNEETGTVKAVVNARSLTALRTAAASLLASHLLASRTPCVLVVFGAGAQIEAHVDLHLRHFPSILRCTIVNRTVSGSRVAALLSSLRTRFHNVEFTLVPLEDKNTVGQWVGQADIICTATSATTPLFETATMKKAGRVHVNLVGSYTPSMRECDDELLRTAKRVVVDSREACAKEAGEIIGSGIGVERIVEIGELVTFIQGAEAVKGTGHVGLEGDILGVQDKLALVKSGNVTVFKTVGIGSQDVAITKAVVERAEELNLGLKVEGYDLG